MTSFWLTAERRSLKAFWGAIFLVVRYFLTGRLPKVNAILLVESGSRGLVEGVIPGLRQNFGDDIFVDLVTCYSSLPAGFDAANTRVYRVTDYRGRQGRRRLYRELAANQYSLMGIICSGEVVMAKWKWALGLRVPAKMFIINENGDYFWVDRRHLGSIRQFVLFRSGMAGTGAVRTLVRLFTFPFTLVFLLLYASIVHARRALRVVSRP